jgi:AraC-like DNA-binding protein
VLLCEARNFTEPSEFGEAIHGATFDMTVTGRGHFAAGYAGIDLGAVRIQRISENLPLIFHSTNAGGRAIFLLHTQPGPSIVRDGVEVRSDSMVRRPGKAQSHFQRSSGPVNWGSISLRLEDIPSIRDAVVGFDLTPPLREQLFTPKPGAMSSLRRLHAAVGSLALEAPEIFALPEVARGMEQTLMQALVACLEKEDAQEPTSTQLRHQKIMRRFNAVLKANATRPLYVLEMAATVGASLRSLSVCCQEHLGMGPKRYLLLRRMHLARGALFSADRHRSTVTDVATQYGFWQFGRFAGQYKDMFGELPSATLHRDRAR